jgi:hypothetical protein
MVIAHPVVEIELLLLREFSDSIVTLECRVLRRGR